MSVVERAARVAAVGIRAAVAHSGLAENLHRPVSLYLLVMGCNLPGAVVASVVGCSKQNVSKHLQRVEDLREQPDIERELTALEDKLFGERR